MGRYSLLTGIDLRPDGASDGLKGMCVNCTFCEEVEEDVFVCHNEAVMQTGIKKILDAVPDGFEIETLTLKPMKLKDPTKKCKNHAVDMARLYNYLENWFGVKNKGDLPFENERVSKENASE